MSPSRSRRSAVAGCALLAICITACGGGGGGAGGGGGTNPEPEPDLNRGSYTVEDFEAPPEPPEGFQPLGTDGFQALSRDELFVVVPTANAEGRLMRLQDDPGANSAARDDLFPLFAGEGLVHAAAFGQLDDDADDELVVAAIDDSETRIDLHRVERSPGNGPLQRVWIRSVFARPWNFEDVRVVLADLDGDFRDEIILSARSASWGNRAERGTVWVFDDPDAGAQELLSYDRTARHISFDGFPIDLDGDGQFELAVGLGGDTTDDGRYYVTLFDQAEIGERLTQFHVQYLQSSTVYDSSRMVTGDFDDDGSDEFAWVGTRTSGSQRILDVELIEFLGDSEEPSFSRFANRSIIDISGPAGYGYGDFAVTAVGGTRRGDGVGVASFGGSDYLYVWLQYDRSNQHWTSETASIGRVFADQTITLETADVDADGVDEVHVALAAYPSSGARLDIGILEHGDDVTLNWQDPIALGGGGSSSRSRLPVLAAGDFDADGFAVEFTGRRELSLADPIPLVVLSAAPTQAGITQNYDDSESAYSTGSSQAESIGVSTYTSLTTTASTGATLFGLLGVEGRASFEKGVEKTTTDTQQETVVRGYRGAYDNDVIVFQGTLYETYEYRIVGAADPMMVGTLMTLDLPIDANTYKWTVDYYNSQVAPEDQIGPDVLTHTPGDIASYPTRGELEALIGGDQHWDMPGSRPVGQGTSSDFDSVSFESVSATEAQRSITKSYGGGASFGVSVSVDTATTQGSTHGVEYGSSTTFEAAVGDIADHSDYADWHYTWGFAIHTVGRQGDSYGPRKHSYQYLRFWADPQGAAY